MAEVCSFLLMLFHVEFKADMLLNGEASTPL